jgi:hypothetical protein
MAFIFESISLQQKYNPYCRLKLNCQIVISSASISPGEMQQKATNGESPTKHVKKPAYHRSPESTDLPSLTPCANIPSKPSCPFLPLLLVPCCCGCTVLLHHQAASITEVINVLCAGVNLFDNLLVIFQANFSS